MRKALAATRAGFSAAQKKFAHFPGPSLRSRRRKLWLLGISVLNPTRGVANVLRMKTPWHRDTRPVGRPR